MGAWGSCEPFLCTRRCTAEPLWPLTADGHGMKQVMAGQRQKPGQGQAQSEQGHSCLLPHPKSPDALELLPALPAPRALQQPQQPGNAGIEKLQAAG